MRKRMKQYLSLFLSLCMLMLATPTISLAENDTVPVGTPEPTVTTEPTTETTVTTEPTAEPTATAEVTEEPSPTDAAPAHIVELTGVPAELEAVYGLYEDELDLPETLTAVYSDDTRAELAVTWECISDGLGGTAYDGECENYEQARFTFEARLPEGALCAKDLILPRVQVRLVLPDLGIALYTAADDPAITNTHGVLSYTYTPPEGVTVTGQQWLLNGNPISGASGATYKLTMADMKNKTNVLSVQLTLSDGNPVTSGGYAMSANTEWEMPYESVLIFTSNYDQSTTDFPLEDNVLDSHETSIVVNEGVTVRGVTQACSHLENQGTITGCTLEINYMLGNFGTIYGNAITGDAKVETDNGVFHVPVTINGEVYSSKPDDSLKFLYGGNALEALEEWYKANCGAYDERYVHFLCNDVRNTRVNGRMQLGLSNSFSILYCTIEAPDGLVSGSTVHASVQQDADGDLSYSWHVGDSFLGRGDTATLPDIAAGATAKVTLYVSVKIMVDGSPGFLDLSASATFSGVAYDVAVDYENDSLVITPRDGVTIDGALVQVGNSQFGGVPVDGKCTLPLSYFGDKSFDASLYVYNDGGQLAGPTSLSLSRAAANVDPADFTVTVADTANADGSRDVTVHCANSSKYNAIRVGEKILDAAETIIRKVEPGQDVTVYARTPGSDADKKLPSQWVAVGTVEASKWVYLNVSSQELLSSDALFWGEFLKIKTSADATLTWKINGEDVAAPVLNSNTYVIPAGVSSLSITATYETGSVTWSESDITSPLLVSLDYDNEQLVLRMDSRCRLSLTVRSGSKYNTLGRINPTYWKLSDFDYPTAQENVLTLTVSHDAGKFDMPVTIPARFAGSKDYGSVRYDFASLDPELLNAWRYTVTTTDSEGVRYADVKFVDPSGAETPCNYDSPTGKWYPVRDNGLRGDRDYSIYAKQYSVDAEGKQNSFASDWFDTGVRFAPCTLRLSNTEPLVGDTVTATIPDNVPLGEIEDLYYKWYYVDDSGARTEINGVTGDSLTIQPDSGYKNRRLRVEAWFVNDRALGYAETAVIPAPEIIVKCDGEELGKNPGGTHYIAYFGDKLTAEVKNASDALDRKWSWLKRGDSSSICDTASMEVDISLCSSRTGTVNLTLGSGDHAVTLSRNMWFKLSPPPEVTIDYENEALVAVRPDKLSLVGCNLRVGYEHSQWVAVFFSNENKFTVPIASIQSDWPGNQAYTVQVEWTHNEYANGGPVGEAATLTIPARPAVQKPTVSAAPFTITVEGVSTGYNVRLTAADAASPDDRIAARPTVSGSDVRFTGLAENTQYKLWVQKKATGSSFRSAWGSFAVSTGTAMELVPSLTWTASYSPNGFSLRANDVLSHVSFTDKSTGRKVMIPVGYLTLTRADGRSFPITDAGTFSLKLTLVGDLADQCRLTTDTLTLTVQPYTVSTYTFAGCKTYRGAAYDPYDFELRVGGAVLGKGDYTITVDDGAVLRDVGEYTAHIVFKGNYVSSLDGVVHPAIEPYTLRATASPKSRAYDGTVNVECSAGWDNCAPFAGDDLAVKASGTMADASAGTDKPVAITLWLEGAQSGNYRLASSTLSGSVNIAKEKAPDIDWPTAGDISYGQCLADSVLSHTRDANGTFAWEKPEHVPTRAMEWAFTMIYTPDDEVNYAYEEAALRRTISIRVNRAAAPEIQWPTADSITYGQRLADSVLTSSNLNGSFAWENGDVLPPAGVNRCNVVFTPDDPDNYEWTPEMLVRKVEVIVDQKPVNLTVGNASKIYGDADPEVEVSVSGVLEGDSLDYTISRREGEDVGEYAYSVELGSNPNYRPDVLLGTLTIAPRDIADGSVSISAVGRQTYTGREIKPRPRLRFGAATLVQGTDYELSYANNVRLGRATITITGMGNFCGSCDVEFRIIEAPEETPVNEPTLAPICDEALQEYLEGMSSLVFDAAYAPIDFAQLPVLVSDGEVEERILLICASQEEDGEPVQRSLILNAAQLVRLQQTLQEYEIGELIFENGGAAARMNLAELTGGNMAKLMARILSGEEITDEILLSDWSAMEDAALSEAAYARFNLEVRIAPVTQEDGEQGFEVSVWLRCDELELNVSGLMENLRIVLDVRHLMTEENADAVEGAYAIARRNGEEIELLDSALALAPTLSMDGSAEAAPTIAGHYALTALYAGEGMYQLAETELK